MRESSWQGSLVKRQLVAAAAAMLSTAVGVAVAALTLAVWASGTGLYAAAPAQAAAQSWLRDTSQATCFAASDIDYYYPSVVAAIDKLPEGEQWVEGGPDLFVGKDLQAAAVALRATLAGSDANRAYIQATDAKGPVIYTYNKITTPKGRTAWLKVGEERPQNDAACETTE